MCVCVCVCACVCVCVCVCVSVRGRGRGGRLKRPSSLLNQFSPTEVNLVRLRSGKVNSVEVGSSFQLM